MSYKIPQENQFYVSNASDFVPSIQYTKNINMDEEGYLRLSAPMPAFINDTITTDFSFIADIAKAGTRDNYKIATNDKTYDVDLSDLNITLDASAPLSEDDVRFVGWKGGNWYVNIPSDIYSLLKTDGTTWDVENTASISFPELFVNRNTLCGVNGSSNVWQFTTADMDGTTPPGTHSGPTLAIPANFAITSLAYSNYRMGVGTRNTTGGSAYFFTWDGATTDASQGFPVYAEMILDIIAYKNSWAVLTSIGQLLYFNGGGFDVLGNLPCYFSGDNWVVYGGSQDHGRTMYTDGDVIYFNLGSNMEANFDDTGILNGFYSGVWCYDPVIGNVYHRHGLSHSLIINDIGDATSGVYTYTAHGMESGDKIRYTNNQILYAIKVTADTYKIAESYDLAIAGTASASDYNAQKTFIQRTDWTQLTGHNTNTGACMKFNSGTAFANQGVFPFFAGLGLWSKALAYDNVSCLMAPLFDNIGGITYYKIKSASLEDTWNSVHVKYKPLTDGDKIIVKYKISESYKQIAIGEADDTSPDLYITWVNSTTFTVPDTTRDLSDVEVGDEVEFYGGAGAGSTTHVVTATLAAGTWTVVLDEAIRGGVSGNKSTCRFDSFKKLGTITKDTTGNPNNQARFALAKSSKWIQIKLELRGNNVVIEETLINNKAQLPVA